MNNKYYAGIGSRKTPSEILEKMKVIGYVLSKENFTLRSGGAEGADLAFESGSVLGRGKREIYLPWRLFNENRSPFCEPSSEAYELASKYHPRWSALSNGAKSLHARNMHQILGLDLRTPSMFVVCYCNGTGGTMQALRVALDKKIPIINLANTERYVTLLTAFVDIYSITCGGKYEVSENISFLVESEPAK